MTATTKHPQDQLQSAVTAIRNGDLDLLRDLIDQTPAVVDARDSEGHSLLGLATQIATGDTALPPQPSTADQLQAVQFLLDAGCNPDSGNRDGWTPLHTAAMTANAPLCRLLLEGGASAEGHLFGTAGGSALSLGLFYGHGEALKDVLHPWTPMNIRTAAALGEPLDDFLVGGKLTEQALDGLDFYRPLMLFPDWDRSLSKQEVLDEALTWAARNGQIASMEWLVDHGATVNANPYRGTPLLWAAYDNTISSVRWLLDHGADPNLKHDFGGAGHGVGALAIHLAIQHNALDCVKLLLDRGTDPHIKDDAHGGDCMGWATFHGNDAAKDIIAAYL